MSGRTILRSALMWSVLFPIGVAAGGCVILLMFGFGYQVASLFTDSIQIKSISGIASMAMLMGAALGVCRATA